jgi:chromosome segregation ATPase
LAAHEEMVLEIQRSATDAVSTLKDQLLSLSSELAAAQERAAAVPEPVAAAGMVSDASDRILALVDSGFEAVSENIARIEKSVEEIRSHNGQFERSVSADLVDIEQNIKVHAAAIESARTAMSQTDDLVERVVEALESLQTAVLDQGELTPERPNIAVN